MTNAIEIAISSVVAPSTAIFWIAVSAIAACVSAGLATWSARIAIRTLRSSGEPKVIVYVKHDPERRTILQLIIENIGKDLAHDIRFKPSRPIPYRAFGIERPSTPNTAVMVDGPLVDGIGALGPGDSRMLDWGQFGGLDAAIGTSPLTLDFTYRFGRRRMKGQTRLEVRSYLGTAAAEGSAARQAQAQEKLAKSVSELVMFERTRSTQRASYLDQPD